MGFVFFFYFMGLWGAIPLQNCKKLLNHLPLCAHSPFLTFFSTFFWFFQRNGKQNHKAGCRALNFYVYFCIIKSP